MLRQVKRVLKFWREYAGKKAIESIDDKVLPKNAKLHPTDKTLQWDVDEVALWEKPIR